MISWHGLEYAKELIKLYVHVKCGHNYWKKETTMKWKKQHTCTNICKYICVLIWTYRRSFFISGQEVIILPLQWSQHVHMF